ncbi:MAG TPA: hypothetical protein ENK58_05995 [Desulfobacterales bacterium]|nr:hypothetical protein [Desulfobacterales bacterium]
MKQKKKKMKIKKMKITPASIVGILFGLLLMGEGLYLCIVRGEYIGYFTVALGLCLTVLIAVIVWARAR